MKEKSIHLLLFVIAFLGILITTSLFDSKPRVVTLETTKEKINE